MYAASRAVRCLAGVPRASFVVLMVRVRLVSCYLWRFSMCVHGPPDCKCIVSLRDRVIVVKPTYPLLGRSAQSPVLQLKWYTTLVCFKSDLSSAKLLRMINGDVLGLL